MSDSLIINDLNTEETASPRTLLCLAAAKTIFVNPELLLEVPYYILERVFTKVTRHQKKDILHIRKTLTAYKNHIRDSAKITRLKNVLNLRIDRMSSVTKKLEIELKSVHFISHDILDTRKLMYVQVHRSCAQTIFEIYEEIRVIKAELSNSRRHSFANPCLETFFRHLQY